MIKKNHKKTYRLNAANAVALSPALLSGARHSAA